MNQQSNMQETVTDRGFMHVHFDDAYGKRCSLSESSIVGEYEDAFERPGTSAVWLGLDVHSMHLSREQVAELVTRLSRWLDGKRLTAE